MGRRWVVLGCLCGVGLFLAGWEAISGYWRYVEYRAIIQNERLLECLSASVDKLSLQDNDGVTISLGYAEINVARESIERIRLTQSGIIELDCREVACVFMKPVLCGKGAAHDSSVYLYGAMALANRVGPKSFWELAFMGKKAFQEYIKLCSSKARFPDNALGIAEFQSSHVKGFARFGSSRQPKKVVCDVWSSDATIRQGIIVYTKDEEREKRRKTVGRLLGSFRYTIEGVMEEKELYNLSRRALGGRPEFVEE